MYSNILFLFVYLSVIEKIYFILDGYYIINNEEGGNILNKKDFSQNKLSMMHSCIRV